MLKIRSGRDLLHKALGAQDGGEFRPQHFYRDFAVVLEIVREIDRSHPAAAEFPLDGVAVGEGRFERG